MLAARPPKTEPAIYRSLRTQLNAGTVIAFRVGLTDALLLEKEFYPEFRATDLVGLPNYHIYLKLMIGGVVSRPFSAVALPRNP